MTSHTLADLAELIGATLVGDGAARISGVADLRLASPDDISFLSNSKYAKYLADSEAMAVVMRESDAEQFSGNKLLVADPYVAYAQISKVFETRVSGVQGVHPSAFVDDTAVLAPGVSVGANAFVGAKTRIGRGTEVHAGASIAEGVSIGEGCVIFANVVIYHLVTMGDHVIVHANTTIGSDGFGYAPTKTGWQKIHQIGSVVIGNDVEIGANTAIDRGALGDTIIGDNVIIDNQVHIAHNVDIGAGTAIAGCVGIAGSTTIGKKCQFAGFVAIAGHLTIADGTIFLGGTIVTKSNREPGVFASTSPCQLADKWRRNTVRYRQLDTLFERVKTLEKRSSSE